MSKNSVYVIRDDNSGLYFNRARLKKNPAVYDLGTARRFRKRYNGRTMFTDNGKATQTYLVVLECELVIKHKIC